MQIFVYKPNLKSFFVTLFWKQNKWHKHGILVHTLKVMYGTLKFKRLDLLPCAILHDIGKPFVAYQKPEDIKNKEYSFTEHEEKSYDIIKNWKFISERTKLLVRYHYLLRAISKNQKPQELFDNLSDDIKNDLEVFLKIDDYGKL